MDVAGHFVVELVLAVVAAFLGGLIAERLRLPVVLGYLLAGVALGPFTPGFTIDRGSVELLAEIGVAFLMFALGTEFSRHELRQLGMVAGIGGSIQILGTIALGIPLGIGLLGSTPLQGTYLGAMLALSSTVVALKVLMARGDMQSLHGRATLGILVAQDIAVVPMMIVLPPLVGGGGVDLARLGIVVAEAVGILLGCYLVGTRVAPWVLRRVAIPRTRELFLLGVVALALGTAVLTEAIGLSFAFGAFLAGLVMAEADFRTQVVAEVLPFRDLFTSLFFVSVGMLIDPHIFIREPLLLATMAVIVIAGKVLITTVPMLLLGLPGRVAVMSALSVAQLGEFSFVLAQLGTANRGIPSTFFDVVLATSLISITLSPFLIAGGPRLVDGLARLPGIGRRFGAPPPGTQDAPALRGHAVVCGCGRVGRELVLELAARGVPCLVVEHNPQRVERLREDGLPVIYGDASNLSVLEHTYLEEAALAAVLTPIATDVELAVRRIRQLNPEVPIIARATGLDQLAPLTQAGADEVVQPEFEAGVEVLRYALHRFHVSPEDIDAALSHRRTTYYQDDD
jgi:monovalent cation:H+ antiporter-2, CPA2 family